MGICSSCCRARDRGSRGAEPTETQPLLGGGAAEPYAESEENDQPSQQRQQELANIVHATHEFFIDVPAYKDTRPPECPAELTEGEARLAALVAERSRTLSFSLDAPALGGESAGAEK